MGRPRKPTSELALRGAFQRNPSQLKEREGEPVVTGALGPPPNTLSDGAKAVWREMAAHGTWLTSADALLVEIAASLMAEFRSDAANTRQTTSHTPHKRGAYRKLMISYCGGACE